MRVVTFKIDEKDLEKIDRLANRLGKARSEVIRMALKRFIEINYNVPIVNPKVYKRSFR